MICQLIVFRCLYPNEALLVATALAILAYLVVRGPVNRIAPKARIGGSGINFDATTAARESTNRFAAWLPCRNLGLRYRNDVGFRAGRITLRKTHSSDLCPVILSPLYGVQAAALLSECKAHVERDFVVQTRLSAKASSVVLIGKDGKEKLRRAFPLPSKELFAVVDAMPMRQAENAEDAMSWITVVWSMIASACLTLALVHGLVWWGRREACANMLFALTAVATTLLAGEMWMMRAMTPEQFGTAVRWTHLNAVLDERLAQARARLLPPAPLRPDAEVGPTKISVMGV